MIPDFIILSGSPWPVLPPGIHEVGLVDFTHRFVYNERRKFLYEGLLIGITNLFIAGCPQLFIDGSYVTAKPEPGDFDLCWDIEGANEDLIDPVLLEFSNMRALQKQKFGGEFFPFTFYQKPEESFLEFFQTDKATGSKKGIIKIKNFISQGGGNYDN
jgi:hypothetical protein